MLVKRKPNSKEHPLKHLAIFVGLGREAKLVVRVIVLLEVQKDGSSFKDGEIAAKTIHKYGNSAVGVQSNEPRFLI